MLTLKKNAENTIVYGIQSERCAKSETKIYQHVKKEKEVKITFL